LNLVTAIITININTVLPKVSKLIFLRNATSSKNHCTIYAGSNSDKNWKKEKYEKWFGRRTHPDP
jgi:hypothetical protein